MNLQTKIITRKSTRKKRKLTTADWLIPLGLLLLSAVPAIGGSVRLFELGGGAEITPDNARFFASPIPVVLHIIGATLYSILGAFQFSTGLRNRYIRWHRLTGRVLVIAGLAVSLTGLWMAHFYPWPEYDGLYLYWQRLIFGSAMTAALILGYTTARQRDFTSHQAWMIRAYAIGIAAGTQVFTHIPWFLLPDLQSEGLRAICMGAGWVINLLVAEWVIRKRPMRKTHLTAKK